VQYAFSYTCGDLIVSVQPRKKAPKLRKSWKLSPAECGSHQTVSPFTLVSITTLCVLSSITAAEIEIDDENELLVEGN
jgi:hypothetical protein